MILRRFQVFLLLLAIALAACAGPDPYPDRLPIGAVQGRVEDADNALRHRSPLNGETVVVRGVVHQILRWTIRDGRSNWGLMIQDLPAEADGDPLTSDGLFVFCGFHPSLPLADQGNYSARVGDIITLRGKVAERFGQTELSESQVLDVRVGGDVDKLLTPVELALSDDPAVTARILERMEGMRVRLPAGAQAVSGSQPDDRNGDLRLWVIPADHPVLARENPSERILFRGGLPLSGLPPAQWPAGHGRKLLVGSLGLLQRQQDATALLPRLYARSEFRSPLVGGIQFSYNHYILQPEMPGDIRPAAPPAVSLPPPPEGETRLRIATYNVENLFDFVNDPFDDCDFEGDPGCRRTRFPLDYVPPNDASYRKKLSIIARQIVDHLGAPDLLMLQEAEDQDIGKLVNGRMVYGQQNNADGENDVLQELVIQIVALGGPVYGIATDRPAADERGIITAFLYKTDRFRPLDPAVKPALFGDSPALPANRLWFDHVRRVANPKAFNARYTGEPDNDPELEGVFSRAVQLLGLEDLQQGRRVWLLNNHFSAGPDRMVERRTQQAAINAELAKMILATYPDDVLVVGGDLNAYPRPDDPLYPPSDQLAPLYTAGLYNVAEYLFEREPANAKSFIFNGEAGILDHLFISPEARRRLRAVRYLPLNTIAPGSFRNELPSRGSDHDPLVIELLW